MSYVTHVIGLFVQNPSRACRTTVRFFTEYAMDRRIGVATLRRDFTTHPSATGDSHPCQPVPYVVLEEIARFIEERQLPRTSFYDVGCGVGRPLAYLSRLGFARMVGIEINPGVAEQARRNVARIKPSWSRAGAISVITGDVLATPADFMGGIVYLANPFGRATMDAFAARLKAEVQAHPDQELHLLYAHPHFSESFEEAFPNAHRSVITGLQLCHYFRLDTAALPAKGA